MMESMDCALLQAEQASDPDVHAMIGLTEAIALEYKPPAVRIYPVAPGVYPTTRFGANSDKRFDEGDAQLTDLSKRLRAQIIAVGEQMAARGRSFADSQEITDRIFPCVTAKAPIHNPTGANAAMLVQTMGQYKRQAFLDQLAAMLIPTSAATG